MNTSKGQQKFKEKQEKSSKVLLVCVYDTIVFEISVQDIRTKFEQYGLIKNIIIFQKGEVTKVFVEFQEISQAVKAKNKLDNKKLLDTICKMSIYFSNFKNVQSRKLNKQSQLQDYDLQKKNQQSRYTKFAPKESQIYTTCTRKSEINDQLLDDDFIMHSFNHFTHGARSKTDKPKYLQNQIAKLQNYPEPHRFYGENVNVNYVSSPYPQIPLWQTNNQSFFAKQQQDTSIKMKQNTEVKSSILWFGYKYPLKIKHIYNIFSNFGNISCIILKKQNVYVKFRTKQFAAFAFTYLNSMVIMGNIMVIRECPEDAKCWMQIEEEYSQSEYYDITSDRFTAHRSISINPPAQTIHVSSIKRESCKQRILRDIFQEFGRVDRVQVLQNSNDKGMALVKFQSLQDSFNAVARAHNKNYNGRKLQISFTKSKM